MNQLSPNDSKEVNISTLLQIFKANKFKYLFLIFITISISLTYTFFQKEQYKINFMVDLEHPIIQETTFDCINCSISFIRELISIGKLNEKSYPRYVFNTKSKIFTVISHNQDLKQEVQRELEQRLRVKIKNIKNVAIKMQNQETINYYRTEKSTNIPLWTNKDIASLDVDHVLEFLKISFGPLEIIHPRPIKHGLIGLLLGLFFVIVLIILSTFNSKLAK